MPDPEFDPRPILEGLVRHDVDFVLIGGLAGTALGSAYATYDVDVAYERSTENLERLAAALVELGATLRGAPRDVPFILDAKSLRAGLNFTFDTRFGSLDILGEPAGAPRYEDLRAAGSSESTWGLTIRVASLDHLIAMKEAAGRDKDKLHASEYRVISDLLRAPQDDGSS
jgi:hypothetical protein